MLVLYSALNSMMLSSFIDASIRMGAVVQKGLKQGLLKFRSICILALYKSCLSVPFPIAAAQYKAQVTTRCIAKRTSTLPFAFTRVLCHHPNGTSAQRPKCTSKDADLVSSHPPTSSHPPLLSVTAHSEPRFLE